jgi:predicted nucleic acid-binding Zn ribbon protein
VGELGRQFTRVETLKNGVLSVTVSHSTLLEELRSYQKPQLIQALRRALPDQLIHDIRFRLGRIKAEKS